MAGTITHTQRGTRGRHIEFLAIRSHVCSVSECIALSPSLSRKHKSFPIAIFGAQNIKTTLYYTRVAQYVRRFYGEVSFGFWVPSASDKSLRVRSRSGVSVRCCLVIKWMPHCYAQTEQTETETLSNNVNLCGLATSGRVTCNLKLSVF